MPFRGFLVELTAPFRGRAITSRVRNRSPVNNFIANLIWRGAWKRLMPNNLGKNGTLHAGGAMIPNYANAIGSRLMAYAGHVLLRWRAGGAVSVRAIGPVNAHEKESWQRHKLLSAAARSGRSSGSLVWLEDLQKHV
jgi:hypothetical protein